MQGTIVKDCLRPPARLAELADAWCDEAAWSGVTKAGGQDLPSEIAGVIALDEVTASKADDAIQQRGIVQWAGPVAAHWSNGP